MSMSHTRITLTLSSVALSILILQACASVDTAGNSDGGPGGPNNFVFTTPTPVPDMPTPTPGVEDPKLYPCDATTSDSTAIGDCSVRTYPNRYDVATLAYEDGYDGDPDNDANDFVMNARFVETFRKDSNTNEQYLTEVEMDFVPRARFAGHDHSIFLVLDGERDKITDAEKNDPQLTSTITEPPFVSDAEVTVTQYDLNGVELSKQTYTKAQNIPIFASTRGALKDNQSFRYYNPKYVVKVHIKLLNPEKDPLSIHQAYPKDRYRIMLNDLNTHLDVDLAEVIFKNNKPNSIDPVYGMIVPTAWKWGWDETPITVLYPNFSVYRDWLVNGAVGPLDDKYRFWFNYPDHSFDSNFYPK